MATASPLFPFEPSAATPSEIAGDHSLLKIDHELDLLMERIENEIEEHGEASKEVMDLMELFGKAMNLKVDRIGRYLTAMEARAAYCRKEADRLARRAKRSESKLERTKEMVLYYLASHDLKEIESDAFTLRRQKNSQDSVIVTNADAVPPALRRFEVKVDGDLWMDILDALPKEMADRMMASVKSSEPSNSAIKALVANGGRVDGAEVKRLFHLRIA